MIPMLIYKGIPNQTLKVELILGSMYFTIKDDDYGRFVHCVFSRNRAREFMRILSNREMAELLDVGGDLLRIRPLNDGYFGIEIESKGMTRGFAIDKQQAQELSNWFQRVHKL
ncbi:hypothetical protein [Bacillus mycoides]|uniref:hypothetical protein n=2 Tax=Bacillus mycoides TaxID=1405 RepID=UPI0025703DF5|nr:hypothetical protein [Bacillus mycoides]MDM5426719.1 hypothetical protein [Bacillus mycoides]MED1012599.1 hypothetical protein [Bacillus mycoides]MED1052642.1 hypothetical protein [Bacillus mycoides]WJE65598.1 hypothetical protein QRE63_06745 [Bacillus mycoides]